MTVFVPKGTLVAIKLFYFFVDSTLLADQLESSGMAARSLLADQLESSGMAALFNKLSTQKKHHLTAVDRVIGQAYSVDDAG